MTQIQSTTVEEKIRDGYRFELDKYISDGFKIFTKEWTLFCIYGLISFSIMFLSLFTVIGFVVLFYPTVLGFSVAAEKIENGEKISLNDFFGAFKNFGSHSILGLIFVGIYFLILIPYVYLIYFSSINGSASDYGIGLMGLMMVFIIAMIAVVYSLQVFLIFAPYLIHYGNYSAKDAILASFKLAKKNFWWILLFNFIVGIIAGVGQYACLIGVVASYPAAMLMNYRMVKRILMSAEFSEIDEIGNSLNS